MLLLLQATQAADSVQVAADELMKEAIAMPTDWTNSR